MPNAIAGLQVAALDTANDYIVFLDATDGVHKKALASSLPGGGGGGVTDHGALTGLADDDHTQYILVDGTRGFTGAVSGQTPTIAAHLSTKAYVDNLKTYVEKARAMLPPPPDAPPQVDPPAEDVAPVLPLRPAPFMPRRGGGYVGRW